MAKRFKKPKEIDEKYVAKVFNSKLATGVTYLDHTKIINHLYYANISTKNIHYQVCTLTNFRKLSANPLCKVYIGNIEIIMPWELVSKYNNYLPVKNEVVKLTYNLFELPDFDKENFTTGACKCDDCVKSRRNKITII